MLVRMSVPEIGDPAPDFHGDSTDGPLSLADFAGEWLVLYFYPEDFTSGCTTEACDFRDVLPDLDAKVLGVSADPVDRHLEFAREYGLRFPLLADEDYSIARAYGAYGTKTVFGQEVTGPLRSTFLIAPDGTVAEALRKVHADGHVERVRQRLEELRG